MLGLAQYFIANNSGLASPAELATDVKLGIVGIGWNLFHDATARGDPMADPNGTDGGNIEGYEIQQAAALKAERPDVGVMVLRNTEVMSTFWSSFREVMNRTELWLQSPPGSGKPIAAAWGSDGGAHGPTLKYNMRPSLPGTHDICTTHLTGRGVCEY
jgi:hypothetical protein